MFLQLFPLVAIVTLGACAARLGPSQSDKARAQPFFEAGVGFYNDRSYPASLDAFEQAARLAPKEPSIEMHRALALYAVGREAQGIALMREACALTSPFPECWNNLSYLHLKENQNSEALVAADKALATATYASPWLALSNRGIALHRLQRPAEAVQAFQQALARSPGSPSCWTHLHLSRSQLALAQFQLAERHARIGRDLCDTDARSHLWLAYVKFKVGDVAGAREIYSEVLRVFRKAEDREEARNALTLLNREEPLAEPDLFL